VSHPRGDRQDDLLRASLEAIINLRHLLVRLAAEINWDFLAKRFKYISRYETRALSKRNQALREPND
jgi:transposase, IS5 family